jgi:hypothetical protein
VSTNDKRNDRQVLGFLGVGLDGKDEHRRLTRSEHFLLVGGSEETHESMQEVAIKFTEALGKRGKQLSKTPVEEVLDLFREAADS